MARKIYDLLEEVTGKDRNTLRVYFTRNKYNAENIDDIKKALAKFKVCRDLTEKEINYIIEELGK